MSSISIEEMLVAKLKDLQMDITTAESCTGGMVASRIVNVSGASSVFEQGFVTYSNAAKTSLLGVKEAVLEEYTEFSAQTAAAMARSAARCAGAGMAVSVTGIAGPDGGTEEKPVGLVYIGCYIAPGALASMVETKENVYHIEMPQEGKCVVKEYRFSGERMQIREQAAQSALQLAMDGVNYVIKRSSNG